MTARSSLTVIAATALLLAAPALAQPEKADGTWSERAPLPEARTEVSVTTDGQRLFLAGGFVPDRQQRAAAPRALYAYDPGSDGWSHLTDLPEGVNHAGFQYLDGRLYVIGGYREATFDAIDDLRIYDLEADRWSDGPPLPTPRGALATAVLDGRIHAVGGTTHAHDHEGGTASRRPDTGAHEVYDPQRDAWSELVPMPTPRNHHAAAAVDGRIVVLAGRNPETDRLTVNEIYDPVSDGWSDGAPVPTGRSGVAAVALDGQVYLFGGETFSPRGTFDEAERYDPQADAWESLPPMPTARHGLGAAALDGAIHVVAGGPEAGFAFSDANQRLEPSAP